MSLLATVGMALAVEVKFPYCFSDITVGFSVIGGGNEGVILVALRIMARIGMHDCGKAALGAIRRPEMEICELRCYRVLFKKQFTVQRRPSTLAVHGR